MNYKINSWWDIQPAIDYSNINQKGLVSVLNAATNSFDLVTKEVAAAFNARFSNFKASKSLRFLLFGFIDPELTVFNLTTKKCTKLTLVDAILS
jgi:hypothetical protein